MAKLEEINLLERSKKGDKEAFGVIVQRYQSMVCSITYSAIGNIAVSEELAQESFIKCWKGLNGLKDLRKFKSWLCTITRNVIRSFLRKQKTDIINKAASLETAENVCSAKEEPAGKMVTDEQKAIVWRALRDIPAKYREPMVLYYRQGQSVKVMAVQLDMSEATAKQRLSRGRKLLKDHVAAIVSETLEITKPGKLFTVAVLAALPAIGARATSAAVAGTATKAAVVKATLPAWLSGAVLGTIIGFLGGIFGAWMSIRNTSSKPERRFMIKLTIFFFAEVMLLLALISVFAVLSVKKIIPIHVYIWIFSILMTAHLAFLLPAVIWGNRRQKAIQKQQGTYIEPGKNNYISTISNKNIYGAFGGSIFGSLAWLFVLSIRAGDYLSLIIALTGGILLFLITTKVCIFNRKYFWTIAIWMMVSLLIINFILVNLRWKIWKDFLFRYQQKSPPLWCINLIIGIIGAGLMLIFVIQDIRQRKNAIETDNNRKNPDQNTSNS